MLLPDVELCPEDRGNVVVLGCFAALCLGVFLAAIGAMIHFAVKFW